MPSNEIIMNLSIYFGGILLIVTVLKILINKNAITVDDNIGFYIILWPCSMTVGCIVFGFMAFLWVPHYIGKLLNSTIKGK